MKTGAPWDPARGEHPGVPSVGKLRLQEEHPFLRGSLQDGLSEEGQCMSYPGEVQGHPKVSEGLVRRAAQTELRPRPQGRPFQDDVPVILTRLR